LLCIAGTAYAQTNSRADQQPPSAPSAQPPAPDQRGSDQMPLSVKIIPREPSKEEAEADRLEKASIDKKVAFETQRVADYTWYLAAFTVVLACVAVGQAGLFVWQLGYMKQGMRDSTKAASAAESAANAANISARAAVGVELPILKLNQFVLLEIAPGTFLPTSTEMNSCFGSRSCFSHGLGHFRIRAPQHRGPCSITSLRALRAGSRDRAPSHAS
jgi:hypothetical protein